MIRGYLMAVGAAECFVSAAVKSNRCWSFALILHASDFSANQISKLSEV